MEALSRTAATLAIGKDVRERRRARGLGQEDLDQEFGQSY